MSRSQQIQRDPDGRDQTALVEVSSHERQSPCQTPSKVCSHHRLPIKKPNTRLTLSKSP